MKLEELAKELKISTKIFIKFIQDFDLELSECLSTNLEVKKDFEKFARENIIFLKRYDEDLGHKKSTENINQPTTKVSEVINKEKRNLFDNGTYKSSISSFGIGNKMGGNYQFVYDYFGKKSSLIQRDFIGYRDLFFYISRTLEPFMNQSPLTDWGIHKTAGIILYGPPGSGKIFWANKIAEITGYRFEQVKRYYYGTSFVDGNKTSFNDFLLERMKEDKVLLFMEDFDKIMTQRNEQNSVSSSNEETKEIILHYIGHFENENLLMVGSANSVMDIDKEILAPGRFDVMIPVFPPNSEERLKMILHHITDNLSEDSLLIKILFKNNANHLPFWKDISSKMNIFSNTMIIDFTQSLKKRIRNLYLKDSSDQIKIDSNLLNSALRDASAKLTEEYLDQVSQFITDVSKNNDDDFPLRIEELKKELEHYKVVEAPRQTIGFAHNEEKKK
ncbi:AAA family ATPase [Kaistella jeonii]|uniref:ATPase AAA n=1 Tax=Kaistella jeonii TaxID=266749 RepID=A0A0C1CW84_9FLAO|nr:ATP-binding protein [Kaistella jeonii]KIA88641.1 ATPase AAA [Kaistella jeonii]SFC09017.1 ATPase family associated with various cellular activities (AAA) [Kaistella jeonii]VEI95200.1 Mycobacterial proteasome ATPase [Kaistella jeonii]